MSSLISFKMGSWAITREDNNLWYELIDKKQKMNW